MYRYKEGAGNFMPREKAAKYGVRSLSDRELISILLGSGTKDTPVDKLASKILLLLDKSNDSVTTDDLIEIKGVGVAKATLISAAIEFSRRRLKPSTSRISFPTDILPAVRHFVTRDQEYFLTISLNGAHEIIKTRVVSIGILNRTLIHPREVFSDALMDRSASLVIAHNHPSGNLEPSREDLEVTNRLVEVGEIIGIKILDHVVFSSNDYYSFVENGKL